MICQLSRKSCRALHCQLGHICTDSQALYHPTLFWLYPHIEQHLKLCYRKPFQTYSISRWTWSLRVQTFPKILSPIQIESQQTGSTLAGTSLFYRQLLRTSSTKSSDTNQWFRKAHKMSFAFCKKIGRGTHCLNHSKALHHNQHVLRTTQHFL